MAAAGKPFTCQFCRKPGVAHQRTLNPKFHKECVGAAKQTGRAMITCSGCRKPIERRNSKTGLCQSCERLSRAGVTGKPLDEQLFELLKRGEQTPRSLAEKT